MHRRLTGSRLVTLQDAYLHGLYGQFQADHACVNAAVDRYLLGGALPPTDLNCSR